MPCHDPRDDYRPSLEWEVVFADKEFTGDFRADAQDVIAAFRSKRDAEAFANIIANAVKVRHCPC